MSHKLPAGMSLDPSLKQKVQEVLGRYFLALKENTAHLKMPNPFYKWRHYNEEDRMPSAFRSQLIALDAYLNSESQHNWANMNAKTVFDQGPNLARLTDSSMLAMFQELDVLYANHFDEQKPAAA